MTIAYIAHPISGDVDGNIKKVLSIVRTINLTEPDVIPFAHYIVDCQALEDNLPWERARGIENDKYLLRLCDELRLYGDRISPGMQAEIELARELEIQVRPMTIETEMALQRDFGYDGQCGVCGSIFGCQCHELGANACLEQ